MAEYEEPDTWGGESRVSRRNLELKARYPSLAEGERIARSLGAQSQGILCQEDTYFHVHRGRLKIRAHPGSGAELIQYHRAETSQERWSDYIAVPLSDKSAMTEALDRALGTLVVVVKERHLYLVEGARIHLDNVMGLGTFVEFEVTIGTPALADALMAKLRKDFRIREEQIVQASYADLLLASEATAGT